MNEPPCVRNAGDAAYLLTLGATIDPETNARVIAIADAIRRRQVKGVRDVVSTFCSVAVYVDPLVADGGEVCAVIEQLAQTPPTTVAGRQHRIPVCYGGDEGPDLERVASSAGLTTREAIARHAGIPYRVFMLGFLPGFAYMGLTDPRLATPRHAAPRLRVPAGSVGLAGRQTGIYPAESPGGWQIIGRTVESVFDWSHTPPARFAPGDTVVFVTSDDRASAPREPVHTPTTADRGERGVIVIRPGLFTTVQGAGRWGEQGIGVPVSGAIDSLAHAIANLVVGNHRAAASLEVTLAGPELRFEQETTIAVAGADLSVTLDGEQVPLQTPARATRGSVLRFADRISGTRAYVAFDGGIRTTHHWPVVVLSAGQVLALGPAQRHGAAHARPVERSVPVGGARVRVLPGPQQDQLPPGCLHALLGQRFTISPQSNRMGYRLTGTALPAARGDMISDVTFTGAIQVPPSGQPILLMADRQTTGGYPQVAVVISADLPAAGQLRPGDWIEFVECSRAEAVAALAAQGAQVSSAG